MQPNHATSSDQAHGDASPVVLPMRPRTQYSFLSLEHRLARYEGDLVERNYGVLTAERLMKWVSSREGIELRLQYGLSASQARMVVCRLLLADACDRLDVFMRCGESLWENTRFQDRVVQIANITRAVRSEFYSAIRAEESRRDNEERTLADAIAGDMYARGVDDD